MLYLSSEKIPLLCFSSEKKLNRNSLTLGFRSYLYLDMIDLVTAGVSNYILFTEEII